MRQLIVNTVLSAVATVLSVLLPYAAVALDKLEQFTSGGHVLGFESGGYYVSNGTYALRVSFEGSQAVAPDAESMSEDSSAETKAASLSRVSYTDLWPGISVAYDAPASGIARSTWTLEPGADPAAIRLRYNRAVNLTESGELGVVFETGAMSESRPVAWQDVDAQRQPVEVAFVRLAEDVVGFRLGRYRADLPLTIDPTLTWNTFLGGTGHDSGQGIAVDSTGNVYVAGYSAATWGSPVRAYTSSGDAFAAKLTSGGALTWNTFLGGSGDDGGTAIAVDGSGNVYVAGYSRATWGSPVRAYTSSDDAFAACLTAAGVLTWNTFLGGSGTDNGFAIAVDGSGNIYVAGYSDATWGSPVRAYTSSDDAFAAKLTAAGTLTWNTFLGGGGDDFGFAIAVDGSDNVYVAGYSGATWGSPVRAYTSSDDAFAAKLTAAGALTWNTFLGNSGTDWGYAIAVDGSSNVYVAGFSGATWGSPVRAYTSFNDGFAAKLTSAGALTWNTFLGGSGGEVGKAIAVDGSDNVYVAGSGGATWGSPVRAYTSSGDAFAAKLTATGALTWNTFLGGGGIDQTNEIALDGSGNVYVAGFSDATWGSPVRAYTSSINDAFVAQMPVDVPPTATPTSTPTQTPTVTLTPGCGNGTINVGEQCDDGNTANGDCCSATCQYEAGGSPCASDGNVCTNDVCNGSGTCGVANTAACDDGLYCNGTDTCSGGSCGHSGNPCTGGGECNNVCNESGDNCFTTGGTTCSTDNNPCTVDQCNGSGNCAHTAGNSGSVCRPIAGPCDTAEQCDGSSATCPTDLFATSGTCRAIAGECDLAESCNGSGASCPTDIFKANGTACTSDGNACTPDECTGASAACVHGDADADTVGDLCDNCSADANTDQTNSDCNDATYFLSVGCAAPPANKAGCCDGGDVCDACPAQKDNADCDPNGSAGASIGPAGGTISTPDGAVTVSIPPGALPASTSITVTENGPATRFVLSNGAIFSASMRPENLQFLAPATITFTWADRDGDGVIDRGTCIGGIDNGLSCDHDADCTLSDCTANTNTNESSLVLKRNSSRFSKGGFNSSPYACADHLSGACSTATANCADAPGSGQATVANCCTPGGNTWTFQTCSFSEYFLGLTAGDLVPGTGKVTTDCTAEWAIRNAQNVPFADRKGLVNIKQTCTDGDPTCDLDGSADGDCVFEVAVCLDLSDPRLLDRDGNVACVPGIVDAWQMVRPRPDARKPVDAANALALRDVVTALAPNLVGGKHQELVTFTPGLFEGEVCTAPAQINVVRRAADKSGKATLKMRALSGEVKDTDTLKLTCMPPE